MNDLIVMENGLPVLNENIANELIDIELMAKSLKERADALKAEILAAMEKNNIVKVDTPSMLISYIAPTDRETLDAKALKAELPEIYDSYCKITPVKASIRIKVR